MNRILLLFSVLVVFKAEAQTSVLNLADSLFATGNYSKAIKHYKSYDQPSEVFEKIAKAYVGLGNYDQAISYYGNALEATPDDVLLKFNCAKLLAATKKYKEASFLLNELIKQNTKNPNYHYEAGVVLEAMQDSTAMDRFQSAFELDSTHQKAIYKIARHFLVQRAHKTSLKYIDTGLDSYPNNVELISLKAQNYYWMEDYRKSATWFEKLIVLGESSQFIHEKLAFCYAKHYDYKKAIEQGALALQYDPKNFTNLFLQGQMYGHLEDFENASKYMARALEIKDIPLDDEYRRLGYMLNRQGKHKEAIEALQKSLKINPNNEMSQFYMLMAKDKYYADVDTRINLYEAFHTKNPDSHFNYWVEKRLKELKEESFMKADD